MRVIYSKRTLDFPVSLVFVLEDECLMRCETSYSTKEGVTVTDRDLLGRLLKSGTAPSRSQDETLKERLLRNSLSSSKCPPPMDLKEHLPGWGQGQGLIGTLERGHLVKRTPVELFCAAVEFLFTPNPPKCHLSLQLERGGCKRSGG